MEEEDEQSMEEEDEQSMEEEDEQSMEEEDMVQSTDELENPLSDEMIINDIDGKSLYN